MAFTVGQKVVCVDGGPATSRFAPSNLFMPKLNAVYTIREVVPEDEYGPIHVTLEEIHNAIAPMDNREYSFGGRRFRPLVSRKTSIDVFTAMLNTRKETV